MKEPRLSVPSGLFRHSQVTRRNDRYLIYKMIGRMVIFRSPRRGPRISGYVERVYRDVFEQEVELTIQGRAIRVREPAVIRMDGSDIVFLYGDVGQHELTDKKLFKEMAEHRFKESMSDTLQRVTPRTVTETRFEIGDKKPSRRKPFLMRGIAAAAAYA